MSIVIRCHAAALGAALSLAALSTSAFATAKTYQGPDNGNLMTSGNWLPTGVPGPSDDLTLGTFKPTGLTGDLHVGLNTNASINSITLNSSAIPAFMILNQTAGNLSLLTLVVGLSVSDNTYNQSGSSVANITNVSIASGSSVGDSYNVLSGSTATLNVAGALNVGVVGNGVMNQASGNVTVSSFQTANLTLGVNAGSSGTYNLTGGNLDADFLQIGKAGSAVFTMSGASTLTTFYNIVVSSTSSTATFNYGGGSLSIPGLTIGNNGTFNLQTGGVLNDLAIIQPGGTFNVAGGSTGSSAGIDMQGGIVQLLGNSLTVGQFSGSSSAVVQNGGGLASALTLNMPFTLNPYLFTGIIRDGSTGALALTLANGSLALSGANTYSGNTTIQAGSFQANATNTFSPNSPVNVTGGTLDLLGFSEAIPSLSGTSNGVVNVPGASALSIGSNNANSTYAGTITGNGTINKVGTGTLTLNDGGSFSGTIIIQGGTLATTSANGIPVNALVTFGFGGTLAIGTTQNIANFSAGDFNPVAFTNNGTLLLGAGNVDNFIGGNYSGVGGIVKNGSANLSIGYGSADTFASIDTTVTVTVNSGALFLNKAPATAAIAGTLQINGGTATLNASDQISDASFVALFGGTLNLNGFNETIGNLSGTAGTVAVGAGTFTVAQSSSTSFTGAVSGSGKFIKSGIGDLSLGGSTAFTGNFTVTGGRLILQGGVSASSYSIASGAFLRFSATTVNLGAAAIQPSAGGTVEYTNATLNGGFLDGPGIHTFLANATFNGTTAMNGATINQTGAATLTNFTNGATLTSSAPLTWNFGTNAPSGVLTLTNAATVAGFTNAGVLTIAPGATLTNTLGNLFLAGGSRTYLGNIANHGGTITLAAGTTLEVNGALLVNDGTISGTTNVNYGGTAEGVGSYGTVNVSFGGTFQPGFASSGIVNNGATLTQLSGSGTIDNTSTANMTLTLAGASASTFSGPIQNTSGNTSLAITGTSSLTLLTTPLANGSQSANTFTGGLSIANGAAVTIAALGALPTNAAITNNGSLSINATSTASTILGTGSLSIAPNTTLTLAPGAGTSKQSALSLTPTSTLNLSANFLIIQAPDALTKATILPQLATKIAAGSSSPFGITTSPLAANLALALIDNGSLLTPFTIFGGQPVDTNSILLAPELLGDANIDGHVDLNDLNTILNHLGTTNAGWTWGGFDGQATIDLNDLNAVLNHLGVTYANSSAALSVLSTQSLALPTPEPASLALLLPAALLLRKRRFR